MQRQRKCKHQTIRRDGSPPSRFCFTFYTFGRIGFVLSAHEYEVIAFRDDTENGK
jgi:hypothetical protein